MHTANQSTLSQESSHSCLCMVGNHARPTGLPRSTAFDPESYSAHLSTKLAELQDFADTNLTAAAKHQKSTYDRHSTARSFKIGDLVWLSIPTVKKLDPQWEGECRVTSLKARENHKWKTNSNCSCQSVAPSPPAHLVRGHRQ